MGWDGTGYYGIRWIGLRWDRIGLGGIAQGADDGRGSERSHMERGSLSGRRVACGVQKMKRAPRHCSTRSLALPVDPVISTTSSRLRRRMRRMARTYDSRGWVWEQVSVAAADA
jgi:hypothetical protein